MRRVHRIALSALLAAGAAIGVGAVSTTARIGGSEGQGATAVSDVEIAQRSKALARAELELDRARAQKPPALPEVPPLAAVAATPMAATARVATTRASTVAAYDDEEHDEGHDDEHDDDGGDD